MVNQGTLDMTDHLLILGGTTEATGLALVLHDAGMNATFSYAGRVARPKRQPLPTRIGGFGGVEDWPNTLLKTLSRMWSMRPIRSLPK